jgi:hypothetical protein
MSRMSHGFAKEEILCCTGRAGANWQGVRLLQHRGRAVRVWTSGADRSAAASAPVTPSLEPLSV